MKFFTALLMLPLLAMATHTHATLNIFACEPEWGALARELGGEHVSVFVATSARQDSHHIEARPSLIARVRSADLVLCTGMELEAGWLPLLLQRSSNARVQPGQPGYFEAGRVVPHLDAPARLDRSDGDVHADGNPHIQLDPRNIQRIAAILGKRLAELDGAHAADHARRSSDFAARWSKAIQQWESKAAPLRGVTAFSHHRDMSYLFHWLGIKAVGTLEPKPGVEPGAAHLAGLLAQHRRTPARLIVRTPYQGARASEWLAAQANIPAIQLPFTVDGSERAMDLFGLFDDSIDRLLQAVR